MAVPVEWRRMLVERTGASLAGASLAGASLGGASLGGASLAGDELRAGGAKFWLRDWGPEWTGKWLELHRQVFVPPGGPAWTESRFTREFTRCAWWWPDRLVLVGTHDRLIGTVAWVGPVAPVMAINWLAVDPDYRGRGIGRALVVEVERRAAAAGVREVRATTLDVWRPAMGLYRKLGYQPVAELPPGVFEG
ncbi:MAG: GNAT family N-acetyltransferase [Pirellulales bacterium]